jgi:sulfatase modifying factor 1
MAEPWAHRTARALPPVSWLLALAVAYPEPIRASSAQGVDPTPWVLPSDWGFTGGMVRLRAPGPRMLRVSAAEFWMGSTEQEVLRAAADCWLGGAVSLGEDPESEVCSERTFSPELPRHRVRLSAYWLDVTEVSVADYARCVTVGRCRPVPFARGGRRFDRPRLPVSLVTLTDAEDYCRYRGARLPTEAEFERAARGTTGRSYPWGEAPSARAANHGRIGWDRTDDRDGYRELAPVGSLPAGRTPEGFLDLAGNVSEWTRDPFGPYSPSLVVDPEGPPDSAGPSANRGGLRVIRGGDYQTALALLRGAARRAAPSVERQPFLGFRCARSHRRKSAPDPLETP